MSDQTSSTPTSPTARQPPAPTGGVVVAVGVLVAVPVVALMWVSSYARETPRLWGMPFFFWYQFLWVFLAAGCTFAAYRIVIATNPRATVRAERDPRARTAHEATSTGSR